MKLMVVTQLYSLRCRPLLLALPFALPACSSPGSSPVTLVRSPSGAWTQSGDATLPWFSYALTSADHEMRSGAEQSVYGDLPERLHSRRVAILSESDHPAAGYMALALQKKIAEVPSVEAREGRAAGDAPRGLSRRPPPSEIPRGAVSARQLWPLAPCP